MMHSSLPFAAMGAVYASAGFAKPFVYTGTRASHAILSQGVFIFDYLMYEMAEAGVGLS
jgi:hypothetical protein